MVLKNQVERLTVQTVSGTHEQNNDTSETFSLSPGSLLDIPFDLDLDFSSLQSDIGPSLEGRGLPSGTDLGTLHNPHAGQPFTAESPQNRVFRQSDQEIGRAHV